jgi:hypothetical protein
VGKEAASIGVVDGPSPGADGVENTVSLRPPRGTTPPPSAPDLPVVAPVARTPTPALRSADLEDELSESADTIDLVRTSDTMERPMQVTPPMPPLPPPAPRFRALWVVAALVLIAAAGVAAGLWWSQQRALSEEEVPGLENLARPGAPLPEWR